MIINNFQSKELDEARKLQQKMCKLHIPCPVISWEYKIFDESGDVIEKGIGKSNSYTRNALNFAAWNWGCVPKTGSGGTYSDGSMAIKNIESTVTAMTSATVNRTRDVAYDVDVELGTGTGAESIDNYTLTLPAFTKQATFPVCTFDAGTRILKTVVTRIFTNATGSSIDVTESGIYQYSYAGSLKQFLLVRDLFSAITVANGQSIVWSYSFEMTYPSA